MRVYLDNAATTKVDSRVLRTMLPFFKEEFGNPSSIHSWGEKVRQAVEASRKKIASFLGCQSGEIIFTSGATEANNLALKGLVEAVTGGDFKKAHLIVSLIEHHCVLDAAKHLEKLGAQITWLQVDKYGLVDIKEIASSIKRNTVLVSVMYVNNEVGTIEPVRKISSLIKRINQSRIANHQSPVYFHTDAVQAVQYLNLNVNYLGVDFLSLSGHKFYAPKGVGLLFKKQGVPLVCQSDGGGQEFGLRAGTENVALIVGLSKALELSQKNKKEKAMRVARLRDKLIKNILKIPGVYLTGHPQKRAPHLASFVIKNVEGEALVLMLDEKGIAASSGSACTSKNLAPSHVLTAMGFSPELAHGSLRLSLSNQTTEKEIDYVLKILPEIIKKLRQMAPKMNKKL